MGKILSTNILDFVVQKRAQILHLPNKQAAVHSAAKKTAEVSSEAAVFVIDQQSAAISGLQHALNETTKVAAALAEAAMLAKDGVIDSADVLDYARRALIDGTVKMSAVADVFDQSPGQVMGQAVGQTMSGNAIPKSAGADPLTSTLRSIRTSA